MKEKLPLEAKVVDVVVNYFNEPKFRDFYSKCEHQIQSFSSRGSADVVLIAEKNRIEAENIGKSPPVLLDVIVECKREGVTGDGPDQLKAYLNVTATRYGIFANTQAGPSHWEYFENQGDGRFLPMTQFQFETAVLGEDNFIQAEGQSSSENAPKSVVNRGANMEIRPTLYVGLGTTGVEILTNLRELNLNEYGQAGLPIFRYVSIETDETNNGKDLHLDGENRIQGWYESGVPKIQEGLKPKPYEVNDVVHTSIPYTDPIRERIDPESPVYDKYLAKWLDKRILDSESVKLAGAGAGNLRMAGRLSLWEKWNNTVRPKLTQAYHAFLHPDHKNEAERFLKNHFNSAINVDNQKHNVFLVGTLCGGTCSGMLLDIAYYFRHIGNADTRIYGIFTMYNEGLALGGDSAILLANCYASLVELDYYKRPETRYEVRFPNGSYINTYEAPFHVATFLSATNMESWNCVNSEGLFEREQLSKMAAKDLFARSLGIDARIEADLANVPKRDYRFGQVRQGGEFVQYMFSSGVEITGKPKYSTITSTVEGFTRILRDRWRKSPPAGGVADPNTLVSFDDVRAKISQTDDAINPSVPKFDPHDRKTAKMKAESYLHSWTPKGAYGTVFEKNSDQYRRQFRKDLDQKLRNLKGYCQLKPKSDFLREVKNLIEKNQKGLNSAADPNLKTDADNAVDGAIATEEISTGIFGRDKRNRDVIDIDKLEPALKWLQQEYHDRLVNHWISITFERMLAEIDGLLSNVATEIAAIEQAFGLIVGSDRNFSDKNVAHVLGQRVLSETPLEKLIDLLLRAEPDAFKWAVRDMLRESFNEVAPNFSFANFSFDKDAHKRSSPYQEFTPNYENYRLKFEQQGGTTRLFRYLFAQPENDDEDLRFKTQAEFEGNFPVPSLQVLYLMEAGYTINDILVSKQLKEAYDKAQDRYRNGDEDPVHIDKNSDKFDLDAIEEERRFSQRLEEIKLHWRACRELFHPINQEVSGYFEHIKPVGNISPKENGALPIGTLTTNVLGDSGIIESFPDDEQYWGKLAENSVAFDNFRKQTLEVFRSLRSSQNDPKSLERLINSLHEMLTGSRLQESVAFYKLYLALLDNEAYQ